jgi:hypothetical protein
MPNNEDLLDEIRTNFDTAVTEWEDIREEGKIDMQYIADGPWSAKERKQREAEDRPCLVYDELGQYTGQAIGDMRQNKRAIKVTPKGDGANDATATMRAGMIREVEYKSNAQAAYATAFENMVQRSYGYFKLTTRYCDSHSFDQELRIIAISNPDSVLLDPYAKEPDWSDMGHAFEIESFSEKAFLKRWPDAEVKSFDGHYLVEAPRWIFADRIQVANYWRVEKKTRKMLLIDGGAEGLAKVYLDELPKGSKIDGNQVAIAHPKGGHVAFPLKALRKVDDPTVIQYVTNGVEILEKNVTKWLEIPIVPVFGPEEWVDDGAGAKRRLRSMVRRARDAYMSYCYVRTNEVEVTGMIPKVLYMGYAGQFNTKTPWDAVNKVALPYGEVNAVTTATGAAILPLPQRQLYAPPIESLEMEASSFRMAIQSAMGIGGMLNGQRSQNQDAKSGKAIEALDRQESQGTYVFISNFERALERAGRLADDALDWVYDTDNREVGTRSPDDKYSPAVINQKDPRGNPVGFQTNKGDHGVTISVGPSEQSTRDAANDFVDTLMNIPGIPPKIMGLAVRLKALGPIGDQIADAFDPQGGAPPIPPAVQQHMAQSNEMVAKLTQAVNTLQMKLDAKIPELQSKERMHAQDLDFQREKLAVEASIGAAKIGSAEAIERLNIETDLINKERGLASTQIHEKTMQAADQLHQAGMQQAGAAADAGAQASDQAHEAATQGSDQAHQAGMQDSAASNAADAAATAAALPEKSGD